MPQLCVSVRFPGECYHGTRSAGVIEWPPSPLRLMQAMVCGALTGARQRRWAELCPVLRWLERLAPPALVAPEVSVGARYRSWVPNNDSDKGFERADKLISTAWLGEDAALHYLWPLGDGEPAELAGRVAGLARGMMALGWGIDLAIGDAAVLDDATAAGLRGERWRVAGGRGGTRLRVPMAGTLDDLIRKYEQSVSRFHEEGLRIADPVRAYAEVGYRREGALAGRSWTAFALRPPAGARAGTWAPVAQGRASHVAAWVRGRLCALAQADDYFGQEVSAQIVAGHGHTAETQQDRFSYLPLPSVGHEHADGMIRRVIVAQQRCAVEDHMPWVRRKIAGSTLVCEEGNERANLETLRDDGVVRSYTEPASTWVSVTPVVLPGWDDFRPAKREKLFMGTLQRSGYPLDCVKDVWLQTVPFWKGSEQQRAYFLPKHLRQKSMCWARVEFREPVSGPVAIGVGRHCGLGLFVREETLG